jgi:cytochrome c
MPAHPSISENDARIIVNYIMSMSREHPETGPLKGTFVTAVPRTDDGKGSYIIRASYTDKGAPGIPSHTVDSVVILRSPELIPVDAPVIEGGALRDQLDEYVFLTARPNSFIAFKDFDLAGIKQIAFIPNWHLYDIYAGGKVEVRIDGPGGELIGETQIEPEQFNTRYRGLFDGLAHPTKEKQERSRRYPPLDPKKFFAAGRDKNSFVISSVAKTKELKGTHDLYFIFKNDSVKSGESLFPLAEIQLRNRVE